MSFAHRVWYWERCKIIKSETSEGKILRWLIKAMLEFFFIAVLFSQYNILFPQERYFVPTTYYIIPTRSVFCSHNILYYSHKIGILFPQHIILFPPHIIYLLSICYLSKVHDLGQAHKFVAGLNTSCESSCLYLCKHHTTDMRQIQNKRRPESRMYWAFMCVCVCVWERERGLLFLSDYYTMSLICLCSFYHWLWWWGGWDLTTLVQPRHTYV